MAEAKRTVVKRVKNGVLYSDGLIKIEGVRGSYLHVDKPFAGDAKNEDGSAAKAKFSGTGILPKSTHGEVKKLIVEQIDKLCQEKKWWKVVDGKGKRTIPATNIFLKDGDASGKDEYEGAFTVKASEYKQPILRDAKNNSVDRADAASVFYSGCYINMVIRPWVQDNKYGKKVNANLVIVQFVKDGEAFGEGRISDADADDMLDSVEDDEDSGSDDEDDTDDL